MIPSPDGIEEARTKAKMAAALVRDHFEALKETGFSHDEALELAMNYQWALLMGEDDA